MSRYPKYIDLLPVANVSGVIRLPGSKSISNRTLLLSALADGETVVRDLLSSDDTSVMLDALQEEFPYLNVDLESHSYERLYDLLYSGNLDFILTMHFPEMEKLHGDLEVMEICQVPQAVIYPKEFGTKKDIADFHYFSFQSADTYHQPVYLSSS